MSYSYTNSKGTVYVLHRKAVTQANGTTRTLHYFTPNVTEHAIDELPAGYTVVEAKTGLPLLKKAS